MRDRSIKKQDLTEQELDATSRSIIVRTILNMYRKNIKLFRINRLLDYQWIELITVHSSSEFEKLIKPLPFTDSKNTIAYATGHVILSVIRPEYRTSILLETRGLQKSFGDLTAIFTGLSQRDFVDEITVSSKNNLNKQIVFSELAEQFKSALGETKDFRNASDTLTLSDVCEVQDTAKIFTTAVYDILMDMFYEQKSEEYTCQDTLLRVGSYLSGLILAAIMSGPQRHATYSDIAREMHRLTEYEPWKKIIEHQFERREVDVLEYHSLDRDRTPSLTGNSFDQCRGTLKSRKYRQIRQQKNTRTVTFNPTLFLQSGEFKRSNENQLGEPKKQKSDSETEESRPADLLQSGSTERIAMRRT